MRTGGVALLLCATVAANYLPIRQAPSPIPTFDATSIAQALGTALPHSLIQAAVTNPAAVASMIASEFAAGNTPDWFLALPASLQSDLLSTGVTLPGAQTSTRPPFALPPIVETTLDPSLLSSILYTGPPNNATETTSTGSSTITSSTSTPTTVTTTSSSSPSASVSRSPASPTRTEPSTQMQSPSSTGAAAPTLVAGLGLPGLLGLAGLLVL